VTKRERFLTELIKLGNIPYIWGGDDPKSGLDCSGLSQAILRIRNQDPSGDQTADMLMKMLVDAGGVKFTDVSRADLGDQIFYGSNKATHIVTYLGEGLVFGANGGGSWCTSPEIARKRGAFSKIQPWDYRSDFICVVRPKGAAWSE
jgi:cell wall-associated NlpC family hydrolase